MLVDLVQPPIDFAFHAQLPVIDAVLFIGLSSVIVYWKHVVEASYLDKTKLSEALDTLRQFKRAIDEHAIVTTADPDGRITHANAKFCEVSQYDRAEVLGKDHRVLNSGHHAPAFFEALWSTITSGEVWHGEIKNRAKDGTFYWVATTIMPVVRPNGRLEQFIAIRTDITDRKRAEEQLLQFNRNLEALVEQRTVEVRQALETLDAAPDGTLVFEAESLRIKFVSAGAVRQVGYDRRELLEMTVADLSTAHTAEALRQALAATGTAGHSILRSTFRRKTGDEFPVEMSLTSAKAERDTPDYIAVIRDITDRLRQEQRVQQAQRLEALGTVTAGIAHDMNNALAPILMAAEILKKEHPSESGVIEILESSARRGATMVQTLLSVAKGKESVFVPLRLEATVEQVAAVVRVSFPGHIQLTVTTPRRLPRVKGDASQLHQLILNLCVNASDAMPEGGRLHLELSVEDVDLAYSGTSHGLATGRYVVLTVQDTGTGIPPEVVARIFEPFFTTKPPDRGTGLGLSSSMGIARAHGGLITVTSTPGAGSTFRLYLPASEEAAPEQPEENTVVPFRGAGQVILLVDDEAGVREMGVAVLTHLGFTPLTAANGTDGLKCLLQNRSRIAAVITDLNMPKMDGIAFARTVRKMTDKLPIAVMSGRMHEQAEHDLAAIQVTVRLTKPFSAGQLSTALRELLGLTA